MRFYFTSKKPGAPVLAVSAFSALEAWGMLGTVAQDYSLAGAAEGERMLWGDPKLREHDLGDGLQASER